MSERRRALLALCLLVPAPTIGVLVGMGVLGEAGSPLGRGVWLLSKACLLLLPLCWHLFVDRRRASCSPTSRAGIVAGCLTAIPVAAGILAVWFLAGDQLVDREQARRTIVELGLDHPARFLIFASAMSLANALLEEYAWRWFVLTRLEVLMGGAWAVVGSALLFCVHHAVALSVSLPPGTNALACGGILVGGLIWGWLYVRYRSIWPGWICHVAADAAVMWITWQMVTG